MQHNPYIGPRPYRRGEGNFFGRSREARSLAALIMTNQVLLYYATSGAGKTSLLNAKVIPELENNGYYVLPVARVGNNLPPGISSEQVSNVFVFSALMDLTGEAAAPQPLFDSNLLGGLKSHLQTHGIDPQTRPPLLIFDQFEEILTTHRARWQDARGFFLRVRDALAALPGLGVVFAMREDYIAGLDPYTPLLPGRLRARFRMELMDAKGALEAVQGPAAAQGMAYAEGVAERLVDDLRRIKTPLSSPPMGGKEGENPPEEAEGVAGQYVETVQLQIVCRRLWANLPDDKSDAIRWDEIERYGDINTALTGFYEDALVKTCQVSQDLTGLVLGERRLRRWFGEQLITPVGTRGLALRDDEKGETAGLPNTAVEALDKLHIIRSDMRAGARWYELCHDRLIEPIVQSNAAWEAARQTPLRTAAKQWQASQNEGLLYRDKALNDAVAWAQARPEDVEEYENEFLQASQQAQQTRHKINRLRNTIIAGLSIGLVIMIALTIWALTQSRIATARQLLAQSQQKGDDKEGLTRSVLLATESMLRSPSAEAGWSVLSGLDQLPAAYARKIESNMILSIVLSPHGKWLAATTQDNVLVVWDTTTWAELFRHVFSKAALGPAFSPDNRWLATGSQDHIVRVLDTTTWEIIATLEHDAAVNTVTFSPDTRLLAASSISGTLHVWQQTGGNWTEVITAATPIYKQALNVEAVRATCDTLATQAFSQTFENNLMRSVVFSPDGKYLAMIGKDNAVHVWDIATWVHLARLEHGESILAAAFSPDSAWLATTGRDNAARVWSTSTWNESFHVKHACDVYAVAFSPNGQRLATVSDDKTARLWNMPGGSQANLLKHDGAVWAVSFSPDGKWLATGSLDETARLWEVTTGHEIMRMTQGSVWALTFASDSAWLAAGGRGTKWGGAFEVWRIAQRTITPRIQHTREVVVTDFSPDGHWFAAASMDGTVSVWETNGGAEITQLAYDEPIGNREVWSIAFSPDSHWLAAGCGDGHARVWNVATGLLAAKLQQGEAWDKIMAVAWSPDGQRLASGSRRTARVWDVSAALKPGPGQAEDTAVANGQEIAIMVNNAQVQDLAFSPDGKRLATAGFDGSVRLWDAASGEELARFNHVGQVWAVAFSPDGTRLASASEDWTARLWDIATKREIIRWGHQAYVRKIAFSPDGWWLAAASWDGTATIWSTKLMTHHPLAVLEHEEEDNMWTVAFSPDSRWLATGSKNGQARVWQVFGAKEAFRAEHIGLINAVTFSPDGRWLASGGTDGTARIWNWRPEDIIAEACDRLTRNLTRKEWKKYLSGYSYRPTCPNLPVPQDE